jgi:MtN3 and saliva related transmembrane protein
MQIVMQIDWEMVGLAAGVLTMFGFVPQILRIYRTESVTDVSLFMLIQFTLGIFLWLLYGIFIKDRNLIISNTVSFLTLIVAVGLYLRYWKGGSGRKE